MSDTVSADEQAIDALVASFYAAFDNRETREPDGDVLYRILAESAVITRVAAGETAVMDRAAFIEPRLTLLRSGALTHFHEWEVEGRSVVLGNIASRSSIYRKQGRLNGDSYGGGGRKLLQLHRLNTTWLISAILWEDD